MARFRFLACIVLAIGVLIPYTGGFGGLRPALAGTVQPVWQVTNQTLDPSTGGATFTDTFTPQYSTYIVDVVMQPGTPGDTLRVQVGPNQPTTVASGEDREFVVSNLAPPVPPVVTLSVDTGHDYGGRILTYSLYVFIVYNLPLGYTGIAASQIPNTLAFGVQKDGYYAVHYTFDSGKANVMLSDPSGQQQVGSRLSGMGSYAEHLSPGLYVLTLQQTPGTALMHWRLDIGPAQAPVATGFQPRNSAILTTSPTTLSAMAAPGTHLLLDQRILPGSYDGAGGRLTYRLTQPLAAGLHRLQVVNAQGVPATASAQFIVLSGTTTAPSGPAGVFEGMPWVHTSTPDGRYSLLKPASWQFLDNNGAVILLDPHGAGFMVLSERYLDHRVNAQQVAHGIGQAFASRMTIRTPFQYSGTPERAVYSGIIGSGQKTFLSQNLVLPEPEHYSLALAFGFGTPDTGGRMGRILARIEASLAANGDSGVRAAHHWLSFANAGLRLDYPAGWLANLSGAGLSWFFDPTTQGLMIALGQPISGTASSDAVSLGHKLQAVLASDLHPGMRIVGESTSPGSVYRWLATYPSKDGKATNIEYGQIALGTSQWTALWGDTTLAEAPVNLPLFLRSLDSAAHAAGLVPPRPDTVANLLQLTHGAAGTNPAAPTTAGSPGGAAQTLQQIDQQNEAFALASAEEQSRHLTAMAILGYSIEYVPDYGSY
ncbi:MAG TPA: hypothetical protein VHB98_06330 [Chloroflexota bacterium]|nr:hypothetical protein [Chloroflexota bacterium]